MKKSNGANIEEIFGKGIKTTKIEYKNPVKELFEYARYREIGRKIFEKSRA